MSTIARPRQSRSRSERRDVTINVRASSQWRALVDRAATVLGTTRSDFVIDSARLRAEDVLLDQSHFVLDDRGFRVLTRILDEAPPPNEELKRLMASKAPWEK